MHVFNSSEYGAWYSADTILDTDDDIQDGSCNEGTAARGEFVYTLYDLLADPYETTNLFTSPKAEHVEAKVTIFTAT
jgi:hypothetical protein